MNIQQQSYEVVARLANMEKMRQMQINMNDVQGAARTLDKMADVFGAGPTAAELRNAIRNSMPRGNMTSGHELWNATLSGFGATYDNGSASDSSVMDMVARSQRLQPMLEDVVPPALSAYVGPGMHAAAYHYATRLQYKVGSSLGAVLPMSVADTDRKIQEVNNRATLMDFVVRSPNLEVGSTLSGMTTRGFLPVGRSAVSGLGALGALNGFNWKQTDVNAADYEHAPAPHVDDDSNRFWFGFFRHGPGGVKTPEQMAAQIKANVGSICDSDDGECASIVEDTLDQYYGDPVEKWIEGGWEALLEWTTLLWAPWNLAKAIFGKPTIRIPGFDADDGSKYDHPNGSGKVGGKRLCNLVYKGSDEDNWGDDYCNADAVKQNLNYLQRTFDLLGPLRYKPGVAEGFNDFLWVGAEGAGNKFMFAPLTAPAEQGGPPPNAWARENQIEFAEDQAESGGGAGGGGTYTDTPPPPPPPPSGGIPMWVWLAGGGVLVLGIGAYALMGGKKQ